jgi:hypothetical protein
MILSTSAVAVWCSRASFSSRVSRRASVSWPDAEELRLWRTAFTVFALRLRALATLLLARERRRIASLKAQDYADFQGGITAGICDRRNGYRLNCAAKFLNWPSLAWVTSRYSGTRPGVIVVRSHLLRPEQALQFARVIADRLHIIGGDLPASALANGHIAAVVVRMIAAIATREHNPRLPLTIQSSKIPRKEGE